MARANTWTNNDGLVVGFGARDSKNDAGATVRTQGNVEVLQMILDYDNLPAAAGTAPSSKSIPVPANAVIKSAHLHTTSDWATADSATLDIGFVNSAGTEIDQDGIDAAIADSALDTGDTVVCDGALVGADVGTSDAYISCEVNTGSFTSGQSTLTIEYIRNIPDTDPTDPITSIVGSL